MNIIITGGSRGIGSDTALALSEDRNNRILITARDQKALRETAESSRHGNISWFTTDLAGGTEAIKLFCGHVTSVFSIVDVLINNAGFLVNKSFGDTADEEIRRMAEVNYIAPSLVIRGLMPQMKKGSHIVNISSMGGFQGSVKFSGLAAYSASKAAIASLTECLAGEFSDAGISVNCLALGSVGTEMVREAFPGYIAPLSSREMGSFVAWFAVNGNSFFNGKILPVALTTP